MNFISSAQRKRSDFFDRAVGSLETLLSRPDVRSALGNRAVQTHTTILEQLALPNIRSGVMSLGRRALREDKIALLPIDPETMRVDVSLQTAATMTRQQRDAICNTLGLTDAKNLRSQLPKKGSVDFTIARTSLMKTVAYSPDIVSKAPDPQRVILRPHILARQLDGPMRDDPHYIGLTLLHEQRHVQQFFDQSPNVRDETEAYGEEMKVFYALPEYAPHDTHPLNPIRNFAWYLRLNTDITGCVEQ